MKGEDVVDLRRLRTKQATQADGSCDKSIAHTQEAIEAERRPDTSVIMHAGKSA